MIVGLLLRIDMEIKTLRPEGAENTPLGFQVSDPLISKNCFRRIKKSLQKLKMSKKRGLWKPKSPKSRF